MPIIGQASIQIRAVDRYFEKDVNNAVKKIKDAGIKVKVDADTSKASKKIRDLRFRVNSNKPAVMYFDANVDKAKERLQKLFNKFNETEVAFQAKAYTKGANSQLQELKERYARSPLNFTAQADTAAARAQLAWAARQRTVPLNLKISKGSWEVIDGLVNTLAGLIPAKQAKAIFRALAVDFEGIATRGTALLSVFGAISGSLVALGGNIVHVVGDLGQLVGLLALAPAAAGAGIAVILANTMAWKNFGSAIMGDVEALAKLPPVAQAAARGLEGTYTAIQRPVQRAFWQEMGTSLQDTVNNILPNVRDGLVDTSTAIGDFTTRALDAFNRFSDSGRMTSMFDGINAGLEASNRAIGPFIDSMAILADVGSQYFEGFGNAISAASEKFARFIRESEETGAINAWIDNAIRQTKNLGSILLSSTQIVRGLAQAAEMAGASGLDELAGGFRNVAGIINSEPFQSRLITILEGAREGTRRLGEGFQELTAMIGESSQAVSGFLIVTGDIVGKTFSGIADMFDGTRLGGGLMEALYGMSDALTILEPGFANLGNIIGDLAEIGGSLFENMAPGLNIFLSTVEGVISGFKDGILAAMPVLNDFVQALLTATRGPIVALAEGIGTLLEVFANLPGPIQTAIAAIGTFLLLRLRFGTFFSGIAAAGASAFASLSGSAAKGTAGLSTYQRSLVSLRASLVTTGIAIDAMKFKMATAGTMSGFVGEIGNVSKAVGMTGLRGAVSGLLGALGGPWGLAITGAITAVSMFGQEQAEAKAKVDALAQSLDQQTGEMTSGSRRLIAADILDLDATAFDDFFRFGQANMEELVQMTGINMGKVTQIMSDPSAREGYVSNWDKIIDTVRSGKEINQELALSVGSTKKQLNSLSVTRLMEMSRQFREAAENATLAETQVRLLAKATNTNTAEAAILSRNYDTLALRTSTVSEKFSALKSNLDILGDGQMSAVASARSYQQTIDDTRASLKGLSENTGGSVKHLVQANGAFKLGSQAGRDFSLQMEAAGDSILQSAVNAFDAARKNGDSMKVASQAAVDATKAPIGALTDMLRSFGLGEKAIQGVISQLGLMPSDIKAALSIEGAEKAQQQIFFTATAANAYASGNYKAFLAAIPDNALGAIGKATGMAKEFKAGDWEAILKAADKSGPGRERFLASIAKAIATGNFKGVANLTAKDKTGEGTNKANKNIKHNFGDKVHPRAMLKAKDDTGEGVSRANGNLSKFAGKIVPPAKLKADDETADGVGRAKSTVKGFSGIIATAKLLSNNNTLPGVSAAKATMGGLKNVTRFLFGENRAGSGKGAAQATMNSLNNVTRSLFGRNMTGPEKAAAQSTLNSLRDVTRSLLANNSTARGVAAAISSMGSVKDVTRTISAVWRGGAAVSEAIRSIGSVVGKTVNVVTNFLTRGKNEDGGLWTGKGQRAMADGGLLKSAFGNVKSFASGSENHVAQISRGQWPVRVWSEPETGGEAYIPLGSNKRPRSLEILKRVAQMFGLGLVKKFANGGIEQGVNRPARGVTSYADGGINNGPTNRAYSGELTVADMSSGLLSAIGKSLARGSGAFLNLGRNIVSGVVEGVNNSTGIATASMTRLSDSLENEFRDRLEIQSPSKKFRRLGGEINKGLSIGIKATSEDARSAMKDLINDIEDAGNTAGSRVARNVIKAQRNINNAWRTLNDSKYSRGMAEQTRRFGRIYGTTLADYARAIENTNARIERANSTFKDRIEERKSFAEGIRSNLEGEFDLGSLVSAADSDGYRPVTTFKEVKTFAAGIVSRLKKFNSKLTQLKRAGVAPAIIGEIAQLGSEEGSVIADAFLQGSKKDIRGLNNQFEDINRLSRSIGNKSAGYLFNAGVSAKKGFVDGLIRDRNSLENAADRLSRTLIKRVKKNLGIRSPSKVFEALGENVGEGFSIGLANTQTSINAQMKSMVSPKRGTIAAGMRSNTPNTTGGPVSTSNGDGYAVHVHPSAALDERKIGDYAARELLFRVKNR